MGKILNDPHTFFENLSDESFFELLDDMGICYSKKNKREIDVKQYIKFKNNTMINANIIKDSNNILRVEKRKCYFNSYFSSSRNSIEGIEKIIQENKDNRFSATNSIKDYNYSKYDVCSRLSCSYVEVAA